MSINHAEHLDMTHDDLRYDQQDTEPEWCVWCHLPVPADSTYAYCCTDPACRAAERRARAAERRAA